MIFGIEAWIFWLIFLILFLIAEALTLNMTTIWFAVGCLLALIFDLFGLPVWTQVVAMIAASLITLGLYIFIIKPRMGVNAHTLIATNADRIIGSEALVTEAIDPIRGTGLIKVRGQVWSAVSDNQQPVPKDALVLVKEIKGVKAVVISKIDADHSR